MNKQRAKSRIFAGRYEYISPLGRGAGGSVYLVEDLRRQRRKIALKVLTAEAYKTVQGKMLRREFEILSKLNHPNLVEVFDYGTLPDGGVYLAEEYIDGFSLQDARALMEPDALINITAQILHALSYLHGMGWIHRDIKPANVMLLWLDDESARPMVKLVDFGLSSMNPKRDTLRGGTRSYMAPEITRGEKGELRSDLFSLGVTLYYALCGVLPFGPRTKEDPPPTESGFRPPEPHRLNPEVPLTLSRFTMALLRQLPGVEYVDAGEALQALARDTEFLEEWSGGVLANSLDAAASPVIQGYFERGILPRRERERDEIVGRIFSEERPPAGIMQLLVGDDGIGKSRLLREVSAGCKINGKLVVMADCAKIAAADSYSARSGEPPAMKRGALIHQLLGHIVELGISREIHAIERYRSYLTILERMSRLSDAEPSADAARHSVDTQWVREAFEDAVVMLHPQQALLCIDNLHLADDYSKEFLQKWFARAQAFHRPDALVSARPGEVEEAFSRSKAVEIRQLEGLTRDDVEAFFVDRLGLAELPDAWLDDVSARAKGKPSYLEEICRNLIDQGILRRVSSANWEVDQDAFIQYKLARNVRESVRRRLMAISASGRECLEILHLVGRPILWPDLRAVSIAGGASAESLERALNTLNWRHLINMRLTMDGRHVSLVDEAVGEVLADMSSPQWRRALHRRVGEAMAGRWSAGGADAFEAALHLRNGGLNPLAATYFELAGDKAWHQANYGRALISYQNASKLLEDGPAAAFLKLKLARCFFAAYEPEASREALEQATELAEQSALDWLIYMAFYTGICLALNLHDDILAAGFLRRLRSYLPALGHRAQVQELEALRIRRRGDLRGAAGKLVGCVERYRQQYNRAGLSSALVALGDIYSLQGNHSEARLSFDEALRLAQTLGNAQLVGQALGHLGAALRRHGKIPESLDALSESLERLSDTQYPGEWIEVLLQLGCCKLAQGELADARRFAADTVIFAEQLSSPAFLARASFLVAEVALAEGEAPNNYLPKLDLELERFEQTGADRCVLVELKIRRARAHERADSPDAASLIDAAQRAAAEIGAEIFTDSR